MRKNGKENVPKNKTTSEKTITKTARVTITKPVTSKVTAKTTTGKAGKPRKAGKPAKASIETKPRIFMLMDVDNVDIGRYTGHAPRQAALKAANAGVQDIRLRETGVRRKVVKKGSTVTEIKVHLFTGSRGQRPKRDSDPDWMPDVVNFPVVEKVGTEWIPWQN